MTLKEQIAKFEKEIMLGNFANATGKALDIIKQLEEIVEMQGAYLEKMKVPKDFFHSDFYGKACIICGTDLKKFDDHVAECLEKTNQLLGK